MGSFKQLESRHSMPGIKGICCAHRFCSHSLRLIGFVLFCCCCGTWSIASGCGCGGGRGMMRMISDICIVHECVCPRVVVCGLGGTAWQSALLCSLAANYLSTCRAPAASQITLIDCARAGVCVPVSMCVCIWYCYTETVTAVSTLPGQRGLANFSSAAHDIEPIY